MANIYWPLADVGVWDKIPPKKSLDHVCWRLKKKSRIKLSQKGHDPIKELYRKGPLEKKSHNPYVESDKKSHDPVSHTPTPGTNKYWPLP